jgi:hypothetical protein
MTDIISNPAMGNWAGADEAPSLPRVKHHERLVFAPRDAEVKTCPLCGQPIFLWCTACKGKLDEYRRRMGLLG